MSSMGFSNKAGKETAYSMLDTPVHRHITSELKFVVMFGLYKEGTNLRGFPDIVKIYNRFFNLNWRDL